MRGLGRGIRENPVNLSRRCNPIWLMVYIEGLLFQTLKWFSYRPTFVRSCRLVCSGNRGAQNVNHLLSTANNFVSFLGSSQDPAAELTMFPILLVFTHSLAIAASGPLCLQLPHSDIRVGFLARNQRLLGVKKNSYRE